MIATATYEELSREELVIKVTELTERLHQLERLVFGSKHERFVSPVLADQLALNIGLQPKEQAVSSATETIQYQRKKAGKPATEKVQTGRMHLPASLPREQVIIEPTEDVTGWKNIGAEITEELERIPGKLFVRQYIRPKYVDPTGERIAIGVLPVRPIEKGIAGPGLLAQIPSWSGFAIPDPLEGRISFVDGFVIPNNLHHMNMLLLETPRIATYPPR